MDNNTASIPTVTAVSGGIILTWPRRTDFNTWATAQFADYDDFIEANESATFFKDGSVSLELHYAN